MFTPFAFVKSVTGGTGSLTPPDDINGLYSWWDFSSGSYSSGSTTWTDNNGITNLTLTGSIVLITGSGGTPIGMTYDRKCYIDDGVSGSAWHAQTNEYYFSSSGATCTPFTLVAWVQKNNTNLAGTPQVYMTRRGKQSPCWTPQWGMFKSLDDGLAGSNQLGSISYTYNYKMTGSDWVQVALSIDSNRTGSLYINDTLQQTAADAYTSTAAGCTGSNGDIFIGNNYQVTFGCGANEGLSGSMGPVLIYSESLNSTDVENIFNYYKSSYGY